MPKIITHSEKETFNFAKKFARTLKGGEVIGLVGDLGAGKTVFAKGIAAGLGIKKTVNSPTFVLMKIYPVKKHPTIKQLVHIDAYRIKKTEEIKSIGIEEYMNRQDTLAIIEWADKIISRRNKKIIIIKIINNANKFRTLIVKI
jgi:tRNA threonylcarbamoyladenosine biosynthesis protein TsaE